MACFSSTPVRFPRVFLHRAAAYSFGTARIGIRRVPCWNARHRSRALTASCFIMRPRLNCLGSGSASINTVPRFRDPSTWLRAGSFGSAKFFERSASLVLRFSCLVPLAAISISFLLGALVRPTHAGFWRSAIYGSDPESFSPQNTTNISGDSSCRHFLIGGLESRRSFGHRPRPSLERALPSPVPGGKRKILPTRRRN